MRYFPLYLLVAVLLSACTVATAPEPALLPKPPSALEPMPDTLKVAPDIIDDPPLTLYPLYDDTPLLSQPESSASRVEILGSNDRVIRFKLREGWAWVRDVRSGHIGWTENQRLTNQPPSKHDIPGNGTISETF